MQSLKRYIEDHSSAVMLSGGFLGLLFPYGSGIPDETIVAFLASLIFFSCFKLNEPLGSALNLRTAIFIVARFAVFPICLWFVARSIVPDYAAGILIIALCPVASAGPALTGIYGGNVTLVFAMTIISNFACVVLIPAIMALTGTAQVHIPAGPIFATLSISVLLPCVLYFILRRSKGPATFGAKYGRVISIVLVALVVFVILTKKRSFFISNPVATIEPLLLALIYFAVTTFMIWPLRGTRADRISYLVGSGLNNVAIGAGLAFLYFDTKTVTFFVCGEFEWCLLPFVVEYLAARLPTTINAAGTPAE